MSVRDWNKNLCGETFPVFSSDQGLRSEWEFAVVTEKGREGSGVKSIHRCMSWMDGIEGGQMRWEGEWKDSKILGLNLTDHFQLINRFVLHSKGYSITKWEKNTILLWKK